MNSSIPRPKHSVKGPLHGIRIVSLALNLPGPAALMRCQRLGARCIKFEPPVGDPMRLYNPAAYAALHSDVQVREADLKSAAGLASLHKALRKADVLLTSFRPSALARLGLTFEALHQQHPQLCQVAIVGGEGELAEEPGHDLTYLAEHGLVTGLDLPATLYADMSGSVMASEAVLSVLMQRGTAKRGKDKKADKEHGIGKGEFIEVALSSAAAYLALPRRWGLTLPGATVGGGHAGYHVYACKDGRVAVAALEPHFAERLGIAAGLAPPGGVDMFSAATRTQLAKFFRRQTCASIAHLALAHDLPLHPMPVHSTSD
jgi:alpha-methylacyl-CoA racemase